MGFSSSTPTAQVTLEIKRAVSLFLDEIQEELALLGEKGVNAAREKGNYTDRTGNLRSSIGYVLAREGKVLTASEFAKIVGADSQSEADVSGDKVGRDIATATAQQLSKDGFALVMTAGMEYASCVSQRGYDVLDSAMLEIEQRIETRFEKLGFGSAGAKYVARSESNEE